MHATRREFMHLSMAAGAAAAFGSLPLRAALARKDEGGASARPLKILILGGTGFIGPHIAAAAMARGHTVTAFNRGKTEKAKKEKLGLDSLPVNVEQLRGNRDPNKNAIEEDPDSAKGLSSLEDDRTWDVVIDDAGFFPRIVKASAELLAPRVKQYVFVSTVSVYKDNGTPGGDESRDLAMMEDPTVEEFGAEFQNYGPLKVLCEKAAEEAAPGRTTIVRPGFIVGPGDMSDRFTYWPVRVSKGGEVLAPGAPEDPIQLIDARDLADFIIRLVENNTMGVFNVLGPQTGLTMGRVLEASKEASMSDATFTWVSSEFLEKHSFLGGSLPIWLAPTGESAGFHRWKCERAVAGGLRFRPIVETCRDTLAWWALLPAERREKMRAGITKEQEEELLAKWARN